MCHAQDCDAQRQVVVSLSALSALLNLQPVFLYPTIVCRSARSFPVSLGTNITGVDANTYSITGDSFSTIGECPFCCALCGHFVPLPVPAPHLPLPHFLGHTPCVPAICPIAVLPGEHSQTSVTLQEDDCSLAYEFGKKFPGYTAQNLTEKGVHEGKLP
eukprot:4620192-Prymnesium_polylepis.1